MLVPIISLLLLGLLLLFAEAILPGGIVGFFGTIAIIASAVVCFNEYGPVTGTIYLISSMVIAAVVGFGAFFYFSKRMALEPPESNAANATPDSRLGKIARTVKPLSPTGVVELEGKRFQAHSESSEIAIPAGADVTIIGIDSTFLVVREKA